MKINTYPEGDFGSVHYRFTARITLEDIKGMFLLSQYQGDRDLLVDIMCRNGFVGKEFPVITGNTFPENMFHGWRDAHEHEVYERNRDQVKSLIERAHRYIDGNSKVTGFITQFYNGSFLRDNRRIQTFSLDLAWHWPRIPGYDKEWMEEPYMPPVLNDWQPNVPPPQPVLPAEIPEATPYVPPAVKTVMDRVREITAPKV